MSELKFKECEKRIEKIKSIESLFKLWREAHEAEVHMIKEIMDKEREGNERDGITFEHRLYPEKLKFVKEYENTISSQFVQFFHKEGCSQCKSGELIEGKKAWEFVLANAFNMDGCFGSYRPNQESGYEFICLLKEANDSKKVCVKDYIFESEPQYVNEWIVKEKNVAPMLNKLNKAFENVIEEKQYTHFSDYMAYMNINKRGGTLTTAGKDAKAVVSYAKKYRQFIMKEIDILSGNKEKVIVFICGKGKVNKKEYFEAIVRALVDEKKSEKKISSPHIYDYTQKRKKVIFVNITHPSAPGISVEQLTGEMEEYKKAID